MVHTGKLDILAKPDNAPNGEAASVLPTKKIYIGKIDAVSCLLIRLWSGLRGNGCPLWLDEFEYVGSSLFHFRYNGTSLQKLQF